MHIVRYRNFSLQSPTKNDESKISESRSSMTKRDRHPSKSYRSPDSTFLLVEDNRHPIVDLQLIELYILEDQMAIINHLLGHSRNFIQISHHRINHYFKSRDDRRPNSPHQYHQSRSMDDRRPTRPHRNHPTRFKDGRRPSSPHRNYLECIQIGPI